MTPTSYPTVPAPTPSDSEILAQLERVRTASAAASRAAYLLASKLVDAQDRLRTVKAELGAP